MNRRVLMMNRRGGAKINGLVALLVIGFLIVLLMPVVQNSRGPHGPGNACMNNMSGLAAASLSYQAQHQGRFPTCRVEIEGNKGSWVISLFAQIDRRDLEWKWRDGNPETPHLDLFVCPSDRPSGAEQTKPLLSYLCNTEVFRPDEALKLSEIRDGAQCTLLISEGLLDRAPPMRLYTMTEPKQIGFDSSGSMSDHLSSRHRGGVNAMFADRHWKFLSYKIDDDVWRQLVNPQDSDDPEYEGLPDDFN